MSVKIKLEDAALDEKSDYAEYEEDEMEIALQNEESQYTSVIRKRISCSCPNCKKGPSEKKNKYHNCHYENCNKSYTKTSHLKSHLLKHTGVRPHICTTCGKSFTRSDELRRHQRTHSGEKLHHCPRCGKSFMRSDHLKKHLKTHKDYDLESSKKPRKLYVKKSEQASISSIIVSEPRSIVKEELIIEEENEDVDYNDDFDDEQEHDFSNKKTGQLSFDTKSKLSETVWVSNGEMFNIKEINENGQDSDS